MKTLLEQQVDAVIDESLPSLTNISNILAILYHELPFINWAGLYLCDTKKQECILGPFQGKVACTQIPYQKGVVGTCAHTKESILVKNVHEFAGHIACDSASQSEVVVPLQYEDELYAILDIDSSRLDNFSQDDYNIVLNIATVLSKLLYKDNEWIHSVIHSRD